MKKEYKLTTIKDIFETVPIDKVPACLNELGQLMVQAKGMDKALCVAAGIVSSEEPQKAFEWPEPITWVDDDKGVVEARYMFPGNKDPLITTKTVVTTDSITLQITGWQERSG